MKINLLLFFVFFSTHLFSQDLNSYSLQLEGVNSYVEAKPVYDPIRAFAKTEVIHFNENLNKFDFDSVQLLDSDKITEYMAQFGYQVLFFEREVSSAPTNKEKQ